jgi:hypothetical protein
MVPVMPSLATITLSAEGAQAGSITIVDVHPLSTVYPRLGISLSVDLVDQQTGIGSPTPLSAFELRELSGELRLSENGDAIGSLAWVMRQHTIRSAARAYGQPAVLACDLDQTRLERIERHRAGRPLRLWVILWPSVTRITGASVNAETRSTSFNVNHEDWARVLDAFGWGRHEIVEVRFDESEAYVFQEALRFVQRARQELMSGRYDQAVGDCRLALESIFLDLERVTSTNSSGDGPLTAQSESPKGVANGDLTSLLVGRTDGERGESYMAIFRKLKHLATLPHHSSRSRRTFTRDEAQFIVRTTENLLGLIGALTLSATSRDR